MARIKSLGHGSHVFQRRRQLLGAALPRGPKVRCCGNWHENRRGVRVNLVGHYDRDDFDKYEQEISLYADRVILPNLVGVGKLAEESTRKAEEAARTSSLMGQSRDLLTYISRSLGVLRRGAMPGNQSDPTEGNIAREEALPGPADAEAALPSALMALPTEILIKILRLVVANRRVFHITPICWPQTSRNEKAISIQQMYWDAQLHDEPEMDCEYLITLGILPTSLVCRQLKALAYEIFYGENQWVFEFAAAVPLVSHIQCEESPGKALVSWSQVRSSPASQPLYPLSSGTVTYVKDLTLCINVAFTIRYDWWSRSQSMARREKAREEMAGVAHYFKDPEAHSLKRFTVVVAKGEQQRRRLSGESLMLTGKRTNGRLLVVKKSTTSVPGRLMKPKHKLISGSIVSPLLGIKGVREVEVSGRLSKSLASSLRKRMRSEEHGVRREGDERAMKRLRSG